VQAALQGIDLGAGAGGEAASENVTVSPEQKAAAEAALKRAQERLREEFKKRGRSSN